MINFIIILYVVWGTNMKLKRITSYILAGTMFFSTCSSLLCAATATWLTPTGGEILVGENVEVAIGYNTGDGTKVTKIELWIDGEFAMRRHFNNPTSHGVASFMWDANKAGRGTHDLVVKIFAGSKLISTVSGIGTVGDAPNRSGIDTKPPVVVFANIKANDILKGTKEIKINAKDDSGENPLVSLLVDDTLKLLKNVPPYTYSLDTTTYEDGTHQLETYAYDNAGNVSDPTVISVSFANNSKAPAVATMSVTHTDNVNALKNALEKKDLTIPVIPEKESTQIAARATAPAVPSGTISAPVANNIPEIKTDNISQDQLKETPVAPEMTAAAKSISPIDIDLTSSSSIKTLENELVSSQDIASQPEMTSQATSSNAITVEPQAEINIKNIDSNLTSSSDIAINTTPLARPVRMAMTTKSINVPAAPEMKSDDIKQTLTPAAPTKIALAPTVKDTDPKANATYSTLPLTQKSTKAKLEKNKTIAKGKVKARDFFEAMGGILFWDNITKTATVIAKDMQIDFKIGSKTAYVNGEKMVLSSTPYIVNGRTIIDASAYDMACALIASSNKVAKDF